MSRSEVALFDAIDKAFKLYTNDSGDHEQRQKFTDEIWVLSKQKNGSQLGREQAKNLVKQIWARFKVHAKFSRKQDQNESPTRGYSVKARQPKSGRRKHSRKIKSHGGIHFKSLGFNSPFSRLDNRIDIFLKKQEQEQHGKYSKKEYVNWIPKLLKNPVLALYGFDGLVPEDEVLVQMEEQNFNMKMEQKLGNNIGEPMSDRPNGTMDVDPVQLAVALHSDSSGRGERKSIRTRSHSASLMTDAGIGGMRAKIDFPSTSIGGGTRHANSNFNVHSTSLHSPRNVRSKDRPFYFDANATSSESRGRPSGRQTPIHIHRKHPTKRWFYKKNDNNESEVQSFLEDDMLLEPAKKIESEFHTYENWGMKVKTKRWGEGKIVRENRFRTLLEVKFSWGKAQFAKSAPANTYKEIENVKCLQRERENTDDPHKELALYRSLVNSISNPPEDKKGDSLPPVFPKNLIREMSYRQVVLLLPVLLQVENQELVERLRTDMELLRITYWLEKSEAVEMDNAYKSITAVKTPRILCHNTRSFFKDDMKIEDHEIDEKGYTNKEFSKLKILCPLLVPRMVSHIDVDRVMLSGHHPCLISCQFSGIYSPCLDGRLFFKPDEVRSDMMVMRMFEVLNVMWKAAYSKMKDKLTPYAYVFDICAMTKSCGLMERVENAVDLREWDADNAIQCMSENDLNEFVRSSAGSFVAAYLMGCRDRHKDNFMIKDNRVFLQIDFKHCFNRKTKVVDSPHFAVKGAMKKGLQKRNKWEEFKNLCKGAFKVARQHPHMIQTLCMKMFNGIEWINQEEIEKWLIEALKLRSIQEKAVNSIPEMIERGVNSTQKKIKDLAHSLSRKFKRAHRRGKSKTFGSLSRPSSTLPREQSAPLNSPPTPSSQGSVFDSGMWDPPTEDVRIQDPNTTSKPNSNQLPLMSPEFPDKRASSVDARKMGRRRKKSKRSESFGFQLLVKMGLKSEKDLPAMDPNSKSLNRIETLERSSSPPLQRRTNTSRRGNSWKFKTRHRSGTAASNVSGTNSPGNSMKSRRTRQAVALSIQSDEDSLKPTLSDLYGEHTTVSTSRGTLPQQSPLDTSMSSINSSLNVRETKEYNIATRIRKDSFGRETVMSDVAMHQEKYNKIAKGIRLRRGMSRMNLNEAEGINDVDSDSDLDWDPEARRKLRSHAHQEIIQKHRPWFDVEEANLSADSDDDEELELFLKKSKNRININPGSDNSLPTQGSRNTSMQDIKMPNFTSVGKISLTEMKMSRLDPIQIEDPMNSVKAVKSVRSKPDSSRGLQAESPRSLLAQTPFRSVEFAIESLDVLGKNDSAGCGVLASSSIITSAQTGKEENSSDKLRSSNVLTSQGLIPIDTNGTTEVQFSRIRISPTNSVRRILSHNACRYLCVD
mmetsp:Transcript_21746/g.53230  ORF Transcript_21746/g.53230 Transcript_21746/m.53230 type:complete len:1384 (+) Transcript_21746:89-4240(+)